MLLKTQIGDNMATIVYESDARPCILKVENTRINITLVADVFPNATMLSAQLRDTLGWQTSKDIIDSLCISPNSQLWDLNHDRAYGPLPVLAIDDLEDAVRCAIGDEYDIIGEISYLSMEERRETIYLLQEHATNLLADIRVTSSLFAISVGEIKPTTYSLWQEMQASY